MRPLSSKILEELARWETPCSTPFLVARCAYNNKHPRALTWTILRQLEVAGLVVRSHQIRQAADGRRCKMAHWRLK